MSTTTPPTLRRCARAIILNEDKRILVFERTRQRGIFGRLDHYYSIPGGGIEGSETPEQAVVREMYEEMLIDIAPQQLVIHQIDAGKRREHFYFLARIIAGTPTFNLQSEEAQTKPLFKKSSYEIAWVELDDPLLAYYKAYGQAARQIKLWLDKRDFPAGTVDMYVKNR